MRPYEKAFHEARRETFATAVNVWNALFKGDRFMIGHGLELYLKPMASSQVWLRGEREARLWRWE